MKALVDPTCEINSIVSWRKKLNIYEPVYQPIPNSARVCQVEPDENVFPVAEPFYWVNCSEQITAEYYYYDLVASQFILIPNAPPYPSEAQPLVDGAQTI